VLIAWQEILNSPSSWGGGELFSVVMVIKRSKKQMM